MNGVFDWLAGLSFATVLAIAVALYALYAIADRARLSDSAHRLLRETLESLLFAWVVVFVILKPFFIQAFYIPSDSMVPTLQQRDRLMVVKTPYWFRGPARGEIVVFKAPPTADADGFQRDYIKRVIGLPGERLEVREGKVWINGQPLSEPYTQEPAASAYGPIIVPDHSYFMMGDNRNNSADSRYWGPLDQNRLLGLAWFRFWPLDKVGLLRVPVYEGIPEQRQTAIGLPALIQ